MNPSFTSAAGASAGVALPAGASPGGAAEAGSADLMLGNDILAGGAPVLKGNVLTFGIPAGVGI